MVVQTSVFGYAAGNIERFASKTIGSGSWICFFKKRMTASPVRIETFPAGIESFVVRISIFAHRIEIFTLRIRTFPSRMDIFADRIETLPLRIGIFQGRIGPPPGLGEGGF
jgi:hypothetical protein